MIFNNEDYRYYEVTEEGVIFKSAAEKVTKRASEYTATMIKILKKNKYDVAWHNVWVVTVKGTPYGDVPMIITQWHYKDGDYSAKPNYFYDKAEKSKLTLEQLKEAAKKDKVLGPMIKSGEPPFMKGGYLK